MPIVPVGNDEAEAQKFGNYPLFRIWQELRDIKNILIGEFGDDQIMDSDNENIQDSDSEDILSNS